MIIEPKQILDKTNATYNKHDRTSKMYFWTIRDPLMSYWSILGHIQTWMIYACFFKYRTEKWTICTTKVWNCTCCQAIQSWIFYTIHFWRILNIFLTLQDTMTHTCRDTKNVIHVINVPRPSLSDLTYCGKTGRSEGWGTWLSIEFTLQLCIGENWYISSPFGWYIYTGNWG